MIERFDIYLVGLSPTVGSEIQKTRPCVIVSPNSVHRKLRTVIVAPMTTSIKRYPTRLLTSFGGKRGEIALDQIRAVDQLRLLKRLGTLRPADASSVRQLLLDMFD